jgi:hypothetical protein
MSDLNHLESICYHSQRTLYTPFFDIFVYHVGIKNVQGKKLVWGIGHGW